MEKNNEFGKKIKPISQSPTCAYEHFEEYSKANSWQ